MLQVLVWRRLVYLLWFEVVCFIAAHCVQEEFIWLLWYFEWFPKISASSHQQERSVNFILSLCCYPGRYVMSMIRTVYLSKYIVSEKVCCLVSRVVSLTRYQSCGSVHTYLTLFRNVVRYPFFFMRWMLSFMSPDRYVSLCMHNIW